MVTGEGPRTILAGPDDAMGTQDEKGALNKEGRMVNQGAMENETLKEVERMRNQTSEERKKGEFRPCPTKGIYETSVLPRFFNNPETAPTATINPLLQEASQPFDSDFNMDHLGPTDRSINSRAEIKAQSRMPSDPMDACPTRFLIKPAPSATRLNTVPMAEFEPTDQMIAPSDQTDESHTRVFRQPAQSDTLSEADHWFPMRSNTRFESKAAMEAHLLRTAPTAKIVARSLIKPATAACPVPATAVPWDSTSSSDGPDCSVPVGGISTIDGGSQLSRVLSRAAILSSLPHLRKLPRESAANASLVSVKAIGSVADVGNSSGEGSSVRRCARRR